MSVSHVRNVGAVAGSVNSRAYDRRMDGPGMISSGERETLLRVLAGAAFLIFCQSYLMAPLIPSLAREFGASDQLLGLVVPAYMLPYAASTLVYGPLSDRRGRRGVLRALLVVMAFTTLGLATARTAGELLLWRGLCGMGAGGIIPISLALLGDLFPYEQRGRALGWIFGAIAGGMAFGSTFGALLNPILGWRALLAAIAAATIVVLIVGWRPIDLIAGRGRDTETGFWGTLAGYIQLLRIPRGARTYGYIFLNGIFHSGIFSWLGYYFSRRYGLGDRGIGLALLGYGVPGLLLAPAIGRAADRLGRRTIIPLGLGIGSLAVAALVPSVPLIVAAVVVTVLSAGFDMSHPLLAGIITSLDPQRRGQAMGLNATILFAGFGAGSLLFQLAMRQGLGEGMAIFAAAEMALAVAAVWVFRSETPTAGA